MQAGSLRCPALRIAYASNTPVFIIGVNAKTKELVLDRVWPLTGDEEVDNKAIKDYYDRTYHGVREGNF